MSERPQHVVWLNTDHYPYAHHVDLPGPGPSTPMLDRLSDNGTRFENAYTPCPLCAPARASLLTGEYPHHHGILNNNGFDGSRTVLSTDRECYSHALQEEGYRTGYFGKWHVGHNDTTAQDYGFEGWSTPSYGYPYTTDRYAEYLEEQSLPDPVVDVEWARNDQDLIGRVPLMEEPGPLNRMNTAGVFETPAETHESFFVTHLANRWLEDRAAAGERFFLRIDTWGPHHPYWIPPSFADTVDPDEVPRYPTFDQDFDDRPDHHGEYYDIAGDGEYAWSKIQRVLARCYEHTAAVESALETTLDTLGRLGLTEDTLIVYTADHGDLLGSHGAGFDKGWLMVEETMRIPMAMQWPDRIPAGETSEEFVLNMDVVPTIYEVAGRDVPAVDADSLLELAQRSGDHPWRESLFAEHHGHYDTAVFQRYLRHREYKYVANLDDTDELYDLAEDPYEQRNRIDDPELADVRRDLQGKLLDNMDEYGDDGSEATLLRESIRSA